MGARQRCIVIALGIGLVACAAPRPAADEIEISPDRVQFCCDPDQPFPQRAGTFEVTNRGGYAVSVGSETVEPGETRTLTIDVFRCGDQTAEYIVYADPEVTHTITIEDRCPGRVEDPEDPEIEDGSLDLLVCESAPTGDGRTWIACEVASVWPPSDDLWSWFVTFVLRAQAGQVLARCTVQRHDGTPATFCDVGDVAGLEVRDTSQGPVMIVDVDGAATFEVVTGTAPSPTSSITGDDVEGPVGDQDVDPPGGS